MYWCNANGPAFTYVNELSLVNRHTNGVIVSLLLCWILRKCPQRLGTAENVLMWSPSKGSPLAYVTVMLTVFKSQAWVPYRWPCLLTRLPLTVHRWWWVHGDCHIQIYVDTNGKWFLSIQKLLDTFQETQAISASHDLFVHYSKESPLRPQHCAFIDTCTTWSWLTQEACTLYLCSFITSLVNYVHMSCGMSPLPIPWWVEIRIYYLVQIWNREWFVNVNN